MLPPRSFANDWDSSPFSLPSIARQRTLFVRRFSTWAFRNCATRKILCKSVSGPAHCGPRLSAFLWTRTITPTVSLFFCLPLSIAVYFFLFLSPTLSPPLSLSLSLSHTHSLCFCRISLSLFLSFSVSLPLSPSLSVWLLLFLSLTLSAPLPLSPLSLSPSHRLFLSFSVSHSHPSLSWYVSFFFCLALTPSLSVYFFLLDSLLHKFIYTLTLPFYGRVLPPSLYLSFNLKHFILFLLILSLSYFLFLYLFLNFLSFIYISSSSWLSLYFSLFCSFSHSS